MSFFILTPFPFFQVNACTDEGGGILESYAVTEGYRPEVLMQSIFLWVVICTLLYSILVHFL